jgi:hypothetical protein
MAGVKSAISSLERARGQLMRAKVRRDSQGSLPKTGSNTYLDDKSMEL